MARWHRSVASVVAREPHRARRSKPHRSRSLALVVGLRPDERRVCALRSVPAQRGISRATRSDATVRAGTPQEPAATFQTTAGTERRRAVGPIQSRFRLRHTSTVTWVTDSARTVTGAPVRCSSSQVGAAAANRGRGSDAPALSVLPVTPHVSARSAPTRCARPPQHVGRKAAAFRLRRPRRVGLQSSQLAIAAATDTCPYRPVPASIRGSDSPSCRRRSCSCGGSRSSGQGTTT